MRICDAVFLHSPAQALHAGTIQQQFLTGEAGGEPRDGVIREERKQGFWSKFCGK